MRCSKAELPKGPFTALEDNLTPKEKSYFPFQISASHGTGSPSSELFSEEGVNVFVQKDNLEQRFLTLGDPGVLGLQKPSPPAVLARVSGNCCP